LYLSLDHPEAFLKEIGKAPEDQHLTTKAA
jgi:hypothetical protein